MMYQGCKVPCNCSETPTHFKLSAVQTDGYVFAWDQGSHTTRVKIEFRDLVDNSIYSPTFGQGDKDLSQAKVKFEEADTFFQVGHYYHVRIQRNCEDLPCKGEEFSPFSEPLLLHHLPDSIPRFPFGLKFDPCSPTISWDGSSLGNVDEYVLYRMIGDPYRDKTMVEEYVIPGDKKEFQCPLNDSGKFYTYTLKARIKSRAMYTDVGTAIDSAGGAYITSCCVATVEDNIGFTEAQILENIRNCGNNINRCLPMGACVPMQIAPEQINTRFWLNSFDCPDTRYFRVMILSDDWNKIAFSGYFAIPDNARLTGDHFSFHSYNPNRDITDYRLAIIPSFGDGNADLLCQ